MASVLTLIAYVLFIILAPTLILLIIPIPLFFKRKFLQIIKFVIKNKYLSLTLLTISILLCLDSFIQLRRFENQKDQIAIDAPMASRITIYSKSQRNMYLTTFNLFLVFVIWRVGKIVDYLTTK